MTFSHEVVLTPEARRDLRSILRYTKREWGEEQRDRYEAILDKGIAEIARFPTLGSPRDDIALGLRVMPAGQHLVFFRFEAEVLVVIRVLHQRMDAQNALDP